MVDLGEWELAPDIRVPGRACVHPDYEDYH